MIISCSGKALLVIGCFFVVVAIKTYVDRKQTAGKMSTILNRLQELREEGVTIRNDGQYLGEIARVKPWIETATKWKDTTIQEIEKMSKSDALQFKTLNTVEEFPLAYKKLSEEHAKWLREHHERLRRLERLNDKYDERINSN